MCRAIRTASFIYLPPRRYCTSWADHRVGISAATRKKRGTVEGELAHWGGGRRPTIYWHFMDGLWVCLFLLLFFEVMQKPG
jgi:hypothetical protein